MEELIKHWKQFSKYIVTGILILYYGIIVVLSICADFRDLKSYSGACLDYSEITEDTTLREASAILSIPFDEFSKITGENAPDMDMTLFDYDIEPGDVISHTELGHFALPFVLITIIRIVFFISVAVLAILYFTIGEKMIKKRLENIRKRNFIRRT